MKQPPPDTFPPRDAMPPRGWRYVWKIDTRARFASVDEREHRKCRRPGCTREPVWALRRSNGWWLYCDWHHYGREISDGWIRVRALSPEGGE